MASSGIDTDEVTLSVPDDAVLMPETCSLAAVKPTLDELLRLITSRDLDPSRVARVNSLLHMELHAPLWQYFAST